MLTSLAPARRRLVLSAVVAVAVVVAATAIVLVVRASRSTARPVAQADAGPVLLVPGYGGGTGGLQALATVLRGRGKDVTIVTLPDGGTGSLDVQAAVLGRTVDAVRSRTGAPSVDVVGYSAGGVVTRLWVRDDGGAAHARRVITLGSPHHGTEVAATADAVLPAACPTACRQLATASDLLRRLNAGDETPAGPTYVSIWTEHDDVVTPPSSARLAGAVDIALQSLCPADPVRHGGLPSDQAVQALVAAELAPGAPVRPSACPRL